MIEEMTTYPLPYGLREGDRNYVFLASLWLINEHLSADIDECSLGTSGCEKICNNMEGGYMCSCPTGYNLFEGKHATLVANHSCVRKCAVYSLLSVVWLS